MVRHAEVRLQFHQSPTSSASFTGSFAMNAVVNLPDVKDTDASQINPARELESCNHLLGNREALEKFYEANGYLLFRQVLDLESVAEARRGMFKVMAKYGLIAADAVNGTEAVWAGGSFPPSTGIIGMEESPEFSGISNKLINHPGNAKILEQVLGEPASPIPIVQYRCYIPGSHNGMVHQDGFYSPGIKNYKPVWITLTNCEREVGGLMIAVGQNRRGYLHNLAKSAPFPIPDGMIPADSWATTDYYPGDLLIVHPSTPHVGGANRSKRCRVTLDTRVQSAADPRVLLGTASAVEPGVLTLKQDDGTVRRFNVPADIFIRYPDPAARPGSELVKWVNVGARLVVVFDGDKATMIRKASEG